jgi:hypothetical protein
MIKTKIVVFILEREKENICVTYIKYNRERKKERERKK